MTTQQLKKLAIRYAIEVLPRNGQLRSRWTLDTQLNPGSLIPLGIVFYCQFTRTHVYRTTTELVDWYTTKRNNRTTYKHII